MNAFLKNAPLQIVQAVLGFATIAAFTRLMTPAEYGRYALILSASMAAHTLALTWAEAAAFRFYPHAAANGRLADHFATLRRCATLALAFALIAMAAALIFGGDARWAISCAIGAAFFRFVTRLARETDRAAQNNTRFVIAECVYLIAGFSIGAILLATTRLAAAAPFAGLMIAGALLALRDAPRLLQQAHGGRAHHMRAYTLYGAPLALALALDLVVQAASRFLIAHGHGVTETGVYAAAFGLARPLDLIFAGFATACAPLLQSAFEHRGARAMQEIARDAVRMLIWIAAPAACGLALLARPLADLLIGEDLRAQAAAIAPWLALSGAMSGFAVYYCSEAFQLARATGLRAALMLAPAVLQLALTALLAPSQGARGAALAACAAAALSLLLLGIAGRQLVAMPLPFVDAAKIAAACVLMAGAVTLLPAIGGAGEALMKSAIGGMVYVAASLALDVGDLRARTSAVLQPLSSRVRAEASFRG